MPPPKLLYYSYKRTGRFVKLLLVNSLLLLCTAMAFGQSGGLSSKVKLKVAKATLSQVLDSLDRQSNYSFTYIREDFNRITVQDFKAENITLQEALNLLKKKAGIEYTISGASLIFRKVETSAAPAKASGKITGKIIDDESGEPVIGATIQIGSKNAVSEVNGSFTCSLPAGTYTALVSSAGYGTKELTDVVVTDSEVAEYNITLKRQKGQLSSVVVKGSVRKETVASLYTTQKNATGITDGISAQQIRVTADNNAAQVLRRVSGIVIRDDKFVTIRGVSDRYNNVLINGTMLPSTEPNRRNFSFDVVPSSMIDNIVINKTATPDLPGEFSGGLVQVNTRDIPAKNFLDVTIGTGFNSISNGRMVRDHQRLTSDYFGFKGKDRSWSGTILQPREYVQAKVAGNEAYLRDVSSRIPNRWQYYQYNVQPVQNYQISGGMQHHFKDESALGFMAGVTYRNEQLVEDAEKRRLAQATYNTTRSRFNTAIGGLFNIAYRTPRHRFSFKNLYNRRFSSQFDEDLGFDFEDSRYTLRTIGDVLINEVIQNRLEGEHTIGENWVKLDWFADRNTLDREQPDTRYTKGQNMDYQGDYTFNLKEGNITYGALWSSRLQESRNNAGVNLTIPFTVAKNAQQVKAGYFYSERKADYGGTAFRTVDRTEAWFTSQYGLPFHMIATPANLASGALLYLPTYFFSKNTGDGYHGRQDLSGYYLMGDFRFFKKLRFTGGARYEANEVAVTTNYMSGVGIDSLNGGSMPMEKTWLKSASLIYSITPKINARLAYGETLARPDFVERSPFIYFDFAEQLYAQGTYGLPTTMVKNYDFRIEYFPQSGEAITVSLFYKDFTNPIERLYVLGNGAATFYTPLDKAKVRGIEADVRKSLGFISPSSTFLKNLVISGNYSYLKGQIETINKTTGETIESDRPIQGLAPYSINAGINYQGNVVGFNMAYNRFGRRILYGGIDDWGIQYELPRDILDMQLSCVLLKKKLELRINATDLLNQPFIIYSNSDKNANSGAGGGGLNKDPKGQAFNRDFDFVNYQTKRGRNYSLNITYKF